MDAVAMSFSLPTEDGPLGWRNWRAQLARVPDDGSAVEFVIFSDAHLTEEGLELGPYEIVNVIGSTGPIGNVQPGLVLRIADHLPAERNEYDWSRTDTTHYHGGGIADECAALLALALGARFKAGNEIRQFESGDDRFGRLWPDGFAKPFLAPPRGHPLQAGGIPMLPGIANTVLLSQAAPSLEIYPHLSRLDAVALLRAARRYQEGLWIADGDPQTSWLHLIGAVETAAARWAAKEDPEETLAEWWPELWEAVERAGHVSPSLIRELATVTKSGKRFCDFLEEHMPLPPGNRPQHGRLDWRQMPKHLRAIYKARSKALHAGIPLPVPMLDTPRPLGEDRIPAECTGAPLASQGGLWRPEDAPMHLHVFAYIAGEALRKWWMSLAA
jgi:hypothetical protein